MIQRTDRTTFVTARGGFAVFRVAVTLVFVLLAHPRDAVATDRWTQLYAGVRYLHRSGIHRNFHVVLIDLSDPGIFVIGTRPADRFLTVREFASRYRADVAVNGNFFDRHSSCGPMMGNGELAQDSYEDECRATIAFGRENQVALFDSTGLARGPLPHAWITEAFSGKPFLLRDGRDMPLWLRPQHVYRANPRTALGISRDRHTLILLVADGRRRGTPGLNGFELIALLREFGAHDAVNLDGGGSSEIVVGGRMRNRPSDRAERPSISQLGIRVSPGHVWHHADNVTVSPSAAARAGDSVSLRVEAINRGRIAWRAPGPPEPAVVLEVDDGLSVARVRASRDASEGEPARFEHRWTALGAGLRTLRARIVAPDGTVLAGGLEWHVHVAAVARPPVVRPHRVRAGAERRELTIAPAWLSLVFALSLAPRRRRVREA